MTEEQLTVQDILDDKEITYHAILQVWRSILQPAEAERKAKITPQWANTICSKYQDMHFGDMELFRDLFFDKIRELAAILDGEIATDDECLNVTTPEEDIEANNEHYINVLVDWQKTFLSWELDWNCTDPDAALELAAISEVHKMFFSDTGITALLDQIKFQFTEDNTEYLAEQLQDLKDTWEG